MRQLLAIFRKDARRSRAHIGVVLLLTALVAVLTPRWSPVYTRENATLNRAIDMLQLVLPLAWVAALAHAVHAEPLAGDRQFWITRPYDWRALLAAKLLFAAAFLLAPYLLSDCVILAAAGFSPMAWLPALLRRQLVVGAALLVPAWLVAALTRSTRQFVLALMGIGVVLMLLIPVIGQAPTNQAMAELSSHARPVSDGIKDSFSTLLCVALVVLLAAVYCWRRVWLVRGVAIGAIVLLLVATLPSRAVPTPASPPDTHPEIAVAFAPRQSIAGVPRAYPGRVHLALPIEFAGRDRDLLNWEIALLRITPADGPPWAPRWRYDLFYARAEDIDTIDVHLEPSDYDRLSRGPVRVDAILAVNVYQRRAHVRLPRPDVWVAVPDVGMASLRTEPPWNTIRLRAPLEYPADKLVYRFYREPATAPVSRQWSLGYPITPLFHLSPVETWDVPMTGTTATTPVSSAEIDVEEPAGFVRRDLSIPAARLADWVVPN